MTPEMMPLWLALITLIQTLLLETLRRRGQSSALMCAKCGAKHFVRDRRSDTDS